ncbi:hypothetical protein IW245_003930 [Longispora fulva]|uniref:Uncharacterized protein n=1 Tax=Longispora fulva TaxID=619741 RepID=A0A8J7KLA6_9ACTN|nr:hypothetical protein [Longispora fulva]
MSGPAGPYPPVQYGYTQPRKNSRTVLIACLSVLVLALLVGGGVIAYTTLKGKPTVTATATPSPAPTGWTSMVGGSAPGLEPPAAGGYPSAWSTFGATDRPVAVPSAVDLGFDFKVPAGWKCQLRTDQPADLVLYTCADRFQAEPVEAEIEVQACPPGCTEQMRTDLRAKQPAWGLQWNLSGPNTVRVTSEKVPGPNGTTRYGIVLIRYWSSVPSGPVDRQVVVRLAGPISQANALQKVGHSVWSAVN